MSLTQSGPQMREETRIVESSNRAEPNLKDVNKTITLASPRESPSKA